MEMYIHKGMHPYALFGKRINKVTSEIYFGIIRRNNKYDLRPLNYKIKRSDYEVVKIGIDYKDIKDHLIGMRNTEEEALNLVEEFINSNRDKLVKTNKRDLRVNDMVIKYQTNDYTSNVKYFYHIIDNVSELNICITKSGGGISVKEESSVITNYNGSIISVPDDMAEKLRGLINRHFLTKKDDLFTMVSKYAKIVYGKDLFINQ